MLPVQNAKFAAIFIKYPLMPSLRSKRFRGAKSEETPGFIQSLIVEYFSMQTRLTATIAPLKNSKFEIVLFSFQTLKTALRKQRYLCQKFPLPIPFHFWKISCFERISHTCLFTRVSFGTLGVLNSWLLWTKALVCKTISTVTLFVLLITYVHIWETSDTLSMLRHHTRAMRSPFSLFSHGGSHILLCQTPDDFTHQRETHWEWKG